MSAPGAIAAVQSRVAAIEARLGLATPRTTATAQAFRTALDSYTGTTPDAGSVATSGLGRTQPLATTASGTPVDGDRIVAMAREYLGVPYVWGGTDPSGFDCSGLVQYVFGRAGIDLPRVSEDQARTGEPVATMADARPGDLLAWDTGPRNAGVDHIAIYAGNGMMIEAPGRGGRVQMVPVSTPPDEIRRISAPTTTGTAPSSLGLSGVPMADLFQAAGSRHGVDPALLAAIASAESGFDPRAVSPAGAQGLMQLMPATAAGLGVTDAFDPAQAIDGAARLMANNIRRYGSVDLALAAYNAGPGAVDRFGGVPPYPETQAYVPKVLARFEELRR